MTGDDEIPLDNPRAEAGVCWSCQKPLPATGQPVSLGPDVLPPVCLKCWRSMPEADRISLAIQFHRAKEPGPPMFGGRGREFRDN